MSNNIVTTEAIILQAIIFVPGLVAGLELVAGHVVECGQDRGRVVEDEVRLFSGSNRLRSVLEVLDGREEVVSHEGDVDFQTQGLDLIHDGKGGIDGGLN